MNTPTIVTTVLEPRPWPTIVAIALAAAISLSFVVLTFWTLRSIRAKQFETTVEEIRSRSLPPALDEVGEADERGFAGHDIDSGSDQQQIAARIQQQEEQLGLLREYHARSLAQSQISFRFSMSAAVFGFIFILGSGVVIAAGGFEQVGVAAIGLIASAIVETVAGLFFVLSNQSRKQLAEFFDKLRDDKRFDEAMLLARQMEESSPVRDRLHAALALQIANGSDAALQTILESSQSPQR